MSWTEREKPSNLQEGKPEVNSRTLISEIESNAQVILPSSTLSNITFQSTVRTLEESLVAAMVSETAGFRSQGFADAQEKDSLIDEIQNQIELLMGYDHQYSASASKNSNRSVSITSNSDLEAYKSTTAQDKEMVRSFKDAVGEKLQENGYEIPDKGQSV